MLRSNAALPLHQKVLQSHSQSESEIIQYYTIVYQHVDKLGLEESLTIHVTYKQTTVHTCPCIALWACRH